MKNQPYSISLTDQKSDGSWVKTQFTFDDWLVLVEKVEDFLPKTFNVISWYAETPEWNAGNNGPNAVAYLSEFLTDQKID